MKTILSLIFAIVVLGFSMNSFGEGDPGLKKYDRNIMQAGTTNIGVDKNNQVGFCEGCETLNNLRLPDQKRNAAAPRIGGKKSPSGTNSDGKSQD